MHQICSESVQIWKPFPLSSPPLDPRSAPGSPSPLRRVPSQPESDAEAGGGDTGTRVRSSMGRRKLGSRHGWGLGLGRGAGGASQSFSVGDQKTPPRLRLRSTNTGSTVIWEGDNSPLASSPRKDTPSTSQENLTEEGGKGNERRGGGRGRCGLDEKQMEGHGLEKGGRFAGR